MLSEGMNRAGNMASELGKIKFGKFGVVGSTGLLLTYSIPINLFDIIEGTFCLVPMRSGKNIKIYVAIFLEFCEEPSFVCQSIIQEVPYTRHLSKQYISYLLWISEYYLHPIEKIIPLIAPQFLWNTTKHNILFKRISNYIKCIQKEEYTLIYNQKKEKLKGEIQYPKRDEIHLNKEQSEVYENLITLNEGVVLLHGVTGSGKTEIYLKYAQYILSKQKTVLILVPEISLTPQMTSRFRALFGLDLAIVHSGLTNLEYEIEWFKIHLGLAKVVLGVRTSIFSSIQNLGLIIIDEEHDSSYKSQDSVAYHARDLAIVRSKKEKAVCILGSATPSVDSMYNVTLKKYYYYKLTQKFSKQKVDHVIIDSKKYLQLDRNKKNSLTALKSSQVTFSEDVICPEVYEFLNRKKELNEQSIIILNRRGYVNFAVCSQCASPLKCPKCSVTTTLHQKGKIEICHYCGFKEQIRNNCPTCHANKFIFKGVGTQQIEELIKEKIPDLKIARLDRDVLTSNSKLNQILEDFRTHKTDCLVGTQMLAKGHDFPLVTLVVVLHVEDALFLPDFRSGERTFQLLNQAMGRAARGEKSGTVVLQSLITGHPIIDFALTNNSDEFFNRELTLRKYGFHPPFSRQILIEINGKNKDKVDNLANKVKGILIQFWQEQKFAMNSIRLAGPYPAVIEKINNSYRIQLCISSIKEIHPFYLFPNSFFNDKELIGHCKIDVDPSSFL
ncbi:primosomal protein N' [Pigmentibacter sp. JX0631]|uniref:replication restart helicase PriA n=1 Tax=Pigmentibacter sp. JX0631 TaxID=2976982 RepID=UPI0024683B41|nr:primosomal protein N' [Pigmentibacter sp. JX0631]WGL60006.1 primosomal protein N' [Pigmentibacter sp. JX0631]